MFISEELSCDASHTVFTVTVLPLVTYALPSFAEQLQKGIKPALIVPSLSLNSTLKN